MKDKVMAKFLKWLPAIIVLLFIVKLFFESKSAIWVGKAISPFLSAIGLAYLLYPIVKFTNEKLKFPRPLSILCAYIILIGVIFAIITIVIPSVMDSAKTLFNYIPEYSKNISKWLVDTYDKTDSKEIHMIIDMINQNISMLFEKSGEIMNTVLNGAIIQVVNITAALFKSILILTISIYFLVEQKSLLKKAERLLYAIFKSKQVENIKRHCKMANKVFSSYIVGKLLDSLIVGVVCAIVLTIIKIPYTPLIALIVGLTNMIPYLGPIIGAVPAVFIALIHGPMNALWVLIVILVLQQVDGNLLGPKILGDQVGVRPFWIITAITLGGAMFGPLGMLLGVPFIVIIKNFIEEWVDKKLKEKSIDL